MARRTIPKGLIRGCLGHCGQKLLRCLARPPRDDDQYTRRTYNSEPRSLGLSAYSATGNPEDGLRCSVLATRSAKSRGSHQIT